MRVGWRACCRCSRGSWQSWCGRGGSGWTPPQRQRTQQTSTRSWGAQRLCSRWVGGRVQMVCACARLCCLLGLRSRGGRARHGRVCARPHRAPPPPPHTPTAPPPPHHTSPPVIGAHAQVVGTPPEGMVEAFLGLMPNGSAADFQRAADLKVRGWMGGWVGGSVGAGRRKEQRARAPAHTRCAPSPAHRPSLALHPPMPPSRLHCPPP